jgi:hypothetical protein
MGRSYPRHFFLHFSLLLDFYILDSQGLAEQGRKIIVPKVFVKMAENDLSGGEKPDFKKWRETTFLARKSKF